MTVRPAFTCGYRTVGFYLCERLDLTPDSPIDMFIPCPVPYVDMKAIGLGQTGMRIIQRVDVNGLGTGIYDIWDYISTDDNPWVPDFIEQSKNMGTSRHFPEPLVRDENFKKLKAHEWDPAQSSRHIYVSQRAIIEDPTPFYEHREHAKPCPAELECHDKGETPWEMCAALWWEAVGAFEGGKRLHHVEIPRDWKQKGYDGPSFGYNAYHFPEGVAPKFLTGIILSIPLSKIEIPQDDSGNNEHERLAKLLADGGWQYNFEVTED